MPWKRRKRLVRRQPETVDEELLSLIPGKTRTYGLALAGILGLVKNDIDSAEGFIQRCPKCDQMSLRKRLDANNDDPNIARWVCFECGNDMDEFGNKL